MGEAKIKCCVPLRYCAKFFKNKRVGKDLTDPRLSFGSYPEPMDDDNSIYYLRYDTDSFLSGVQDFGGGKKVGKPVMAADSKTRRRLTEAQRTQRRMISCSLICEN